MRNRRLAIAGVALVAAIGLAGCNQADTSTTGTGSAGTAAQTTAPADPTAEVAAAAAKLGGESFKVTMDMAAGIKAEGGFDAAAGNMNLTMSLGGAASGGQDTQIQMRKIGDDLYMKFGGSMGEALGANAGKWMHIDSSKVPANSPFSPETNDPKNSAKLLASAAQVQKTGDGAYKGVLDITKSPTANAESLKALGDKAKAVPFTAKVDDQGRLTEMTIEMNAIAPGAGALTTKYTDFGTKVAVQKPAAADVVEMPKSMQGLFDA